MSFKIAEERDTEVYATCLKFIFIYIFDNLQFNILSRTIYTVIFLQNT